MIAIRHQPRTVHDIDRAAADDLESDLGTVSLRVLRLGK
jgi:hypothetical protein